ncbi:MAG: adenylate kinase [Clostridiales bacterium]|nr:adenylate kinase [Clostridiales bacterium]
MRLILLGAPGAGKGTQAGIISEKYNIPSISTGALIRQAIAEQTPLGMSAKAYTDTGALVPDEVVIGMIKERLAQPDCADGFILDGFPRTVPQAQALEKMGVAITDVISIEVPDEQIQRRMGGRRVCGTCGATFHVEYNPSPAGDRCPCGGTLTIRSDDKAAVVASRLATYHSMTEPLKEYYAGKGLLKIVHGQEQIADTTALTLAALADEGQGGKKELS